MASRPSRKEIMVAALALIALAWAGLHFTGGLHVDQNHRAATNLTLELEPVHENLSFPVSMAVAPDGRIFFNERGTGAVRVIDNGTLHPHPVAKEDVVVDLDTGLIGLALHPDFPEEPWLYLYYTDRAEDGDLQGHVVRHRVEGHTSVEREVIVSALPAARMHSGGILEFGPDGNLYVAVGDAEQQWWVQAPWAPNGKILMYTPTGEHPEAPIPFSNAFSMGHRNVFGLAWDSRTGTLYATENGPEDADEVNRILPGGNYGWPITRGHSRLPFTNPERAYEVIIAPTEAAFYTGDQLGPEYEHNLFYGSYKGGLYRAVVDAESGRIVRDEVAYQGTQIVDVENGPDGHLYVTTPVGIYRATPAINGDA